MDKRIVIKKYQSPLRKSKMRYLMQCLACGKEFDIMQRDYNRGRGIYCGNTCNAKSRLWKGNPRWNGGSKMNNGYKYIQKDLVEKKYHYLVSQHCYIPEHRLVVAKNFSKKLRKCDLVHHLNGIRTDNRIENLSVTDSSKHEHRTVEKQMAKRILELEQILNNRGDIV